MLVYIRIKKDNKLNHQTGAITKALKVTKKKVKALIVYQSVLMAAGFSQLLQADSYYVPYLVTIIMGFLSLGWNAKELLLQEDCCCSPRFDRRLTGVFSFLFASMITLANYKLWLFRSYASPLVFAVVFLGSFFAFKNILFWLANNIQRITWKAVETVNLLRTFFITFLFISCLNLSILFLCKYPGNLSVDSIDQMNQLITGVYTNHHPFYHTLIIKILISIGFQLFHEINAAVAFYSAFSILFIAASFSFAIYTVAELRIPKRIIILLQLFFALMPYHIMYSMTMWKDIFFGASALLYIVFFYRCITQMKLRTFNYCGLIVSAFGICLLRSNGYVVFILTTLCFLSLWRFQKKRIIFIMAAVLVCSFILKHPVLKIIGVTQPDLLESLSIPTQQIARDIVDHNDLTNKQKTLLSQVVDINQIPKRYSPILSDPIKQLIRDKGNQSYIQSNATDYIQLYFSLGIKHPLTYLRGWIDQTRGYWNAGYSYWRWFDKVENNDLGIERTVYSKNTCAALDWYLTQFSEQPTLQIFLCIGFFNWLLFIGLYIAIIRRDKVGVMLIIPNVMILLSLLVATPVYAEFRYSYATFCILPISFVLILRPEFLIHEKKSV